MACLQFNLYSILPVVEMWSRLQVVSRIQLVDLSMMLETDENLLLLCRDKNKKPKEFTSNYIVLFPGEVETIYPPCFAGNFDIFENASPTNQSFLLKTKITWVSIFPYLQYFFNFFFSLFCPLDCFPSSLT